MRAHFTDNELPFLAFLLEPAQAQAVYQHLSEFSLPKHPTPNKAMKIYQSSKHPGTLASGR